MIPFAGTGTLDKEPQLCTSKRYLKLVDFIDAGSLPPPMHRSEFSGVILDIGVRNWMGQQLASHFNVDLEQTEVYDFNVHVVSPREKYPVIFCFDVLEHIANPAFFLDKLRKKLLDGGCLYISVPVAPLLNWRQSYTHFNEYHPVALEELFEYVGLNVVKKEIYHSWQWWYGFFGVRPFLRAVFHKHGLYKLVAK